MENNFVTSNSATVSYVSALFRKTYLWMAFALLITAISALLVVKSPALQSFIFSNSFAVWGLLIAEVVLVMALVARINRLSLSSAALMFILYSVLNGLTLSVIFFVYDIATIAQTFFITAGTFAGISLYGFITKTDLSKFGSILVMALWGLIIATVVNLFFASSVLSMVISYVGVIVFVGLTAWDTQKLKTMYMEAEGMNESSLKVALLGALTLYLDFVNLFLYILRIFGNRD